MDIYRHREGVSIYLQTHQILENDELLNLINSVPEMSDSGKHHCYTVFIGGSYYLVITH